MISLLLVAHFALFFVGFSFSRAQWRLRLASPLLPVGCAFLYLAVGQGADSLTRRSPDIDETDIGVALLVSLCSYAAFSLGYFLSRPRRKAPAIRNPRLLSRYGIALIMLGLTGLVAFVASTGISAFLGYSPREINPYDALSGYVYRLPDLMYAGIAVLSISYLTGELGRAGRGLLFFTVVLQVLLAIESTDRGNLMRSVLPLIVLIAATRRPGLFLQAARKCIPILAASMIAGVLLFPYFRDTGRHLFTSTKTISEVTETVTQSGFSSRFSNLGGEFDTAARIVKWVNSGDVQPPGPIHIALTLWGFVPRRLVPEKHNMFADWAGPELDRIASAASYYGCALTGWGEAYAFLGPLGAFLYWVALGISSRLLQTNFTHPIEGPVLAAAAFVPLLQFVEMGFWAGSMNFLFVLVPAVIVLKISRPKKYRLDRARSDTQSQDLPNSGHSCHLLRGAQSRLPNANTNPFGPSRPQASIR